MHIYKTNHQDLQKCSIIHVIEHTYKCIFVCVCVCACARAQQSLMQGDGTHKDITLLRVIRKLLFIAL